MFVMDKAYGEPYHRKPQEPERRPTPWEISAIIFFGSMYAGVVISLSVQEFYRRRLYGR